MDRAYWRLTALDRHEQSSFTELGTQALEAAGVRFIDDGERIGLAARS